MTPIDDQAIGELIGSVKALERRMDDHVRLCERALDVIRSEQVTASETIRDAINTHIKDYQKRVAALENWRNWIAGGLSAFAALWTAVWAWIIAHLVGKR